MIPSFGSQPPWRSSLLSVAGPVVGTKRALRHRHDFPAGDQCLCDAVVAQGAACSCPVCRCIQAGAGGTQQWHMPVAAACVQ